MKNKCSNFAKLQPDLNGNPFLHKLKFYLNGNRLQKRLGVEGGNSCPNYFPKSSRTSD